MVLDTAAAPRRGREEAGGTGHPQIVARPPNLAVLLTHCGQLIPRKTSKFDAIRCQTLRLKCTKFDFGWGSAPDPAEEAYSAPETPGCRATYGAYF